MIAVRTAASPTRALYRIGWAPDPLEWPDPEYRGAGRFDDPQARFGTLYAAAQRRACFLEILAERRPSLEDLALRRQVANTEERPPLAHPRIPDDWYETHRLVRVRLMPSQRWLDLRRIETRQALRGEFAERIRDFGLSDLDVSAVLTSHRELTQRIAGWAYDQGYKGIVYPSRLSQKLTCWAVFQGARVEPVSPIEFITRDDSDLRAVAKLYGLVV